MTKALRWLRVRCPKCGHLFGFRYKLSWLFRDVFNPKKTKIEGIGTDDPRSAGTSKEGDEAA